MSDKKALGNQGELQAREFIKKKGYKIITQNQTTPYGEIDIIAIHNYELVIVEVKTRTSSLFGRPQDAITQSKLTHLANAAEYYRSNNPKLPQAIRIDVVEVYAGNPPQFNLIPRVDQQI